MYPSVQSYSRNPVKLKESPLSVPSQEGFLTLSYVEPSRHLFYKPVCSQPPYAIQLTMRNQLQHSWMTHCLCKYLISSALKNKEHLILKYICQELTTAYRFVDQSFVTFVHLVNIFIQSDLDCTHFISFFLSLEIKPTWATGRLFVRCKKN